MARGDLQVIKDQFSRTVRVAASATRFEVGEPLIQAGVSWSSGAASANVFTLAAIDILVIGTDVLGGISKEQAEPKNSTDTLVAQTVTLSCPLPFAGHIRGTAETTASIDTAAELLGVIQDYVLIDYNATGAADGGELYTIKETASADTSGFQVEDGDIFKGTLDVATHPHCYRFDITT